MTNFSFWQMIHITWDPRVNRTYGDGLWAYQESWALYFLRWIEIEESK